MNDPRLTPARGDVAAASLRGQVDAKRFVEGVAHQVVASIANLRAAPATDARLDTQLLFGETFTVYDTQDGFAWGQSGVDDYVGYVQASTLQAPPLQPTHRVAELQTIAYVRPDIKSPPWNFLSLNAKLTVEAEDGPFVRVARSGYVFARHLAPIGAEEHDFVAVAERFHGFPYLWGGKGWFGLDCSGLIQTALETIGVKAPRDSDMQERALGRALTIDAALSGLQRGDLLFWEGHVGVMTDGAHLLHANGFHMQTEIEPLADAVTRIGPPRTIKRL